jgi:NAD(P)-dependent dehydrogenase (short-subunit alcohol dehydrogenase family)
MSGIRGKRHEDDRIVVATGGAGGIGSKIVDRFLANGDTIFAINNRWGGPTWNLDRRAPLKAAGGVEVRISYRKVMGRRS